MITGLPTGIRRVLARAAGVAAILFLTGSAQALTFISPMGEPFRSRPGDKLPEEIWFERADADNDGKITRAEFLADAGRFFRTLDVNHNGEIGPEEIEHYEEDIAPEVRTGGFDLPIPDEAGGGHRGNRGEGGGSRRRASVPSGRNRDDNVTSLSVEPQPEQPEYYDAAGQGGARYSYLDLPEPVAAADLNLDRAISPREFVQAARERFDTLDINHDGVLTRDELPHLEGARPGRMPPDKAREHRPPREGGGGAPA